MKAMKSRIEYWNKPRATVKWLNMTKDVDVDS